MIQKFGFNFQVQNWQEWVLYPISKPSSTTQSEQMAKVTDEPTVNYGPREVAEEEEE